MRRYVEAGPGQLGVQHDGARALVNCAGLACSYATPESRKRPQKSGHSYTLSMAAYNDVQD